MFHVPDLSIMSSDIIEGIYAANLFILLNGGRIGDKKAGRSIRKAIMEGTNYNNVI